MAQTVKTGEKKPICNASIGIVGGVGPNAGLDLMHKIMSQTKTRSDQDHLPVSLLSFADKIPDRTEYLLGRVRENPAFEIVKVLNKLERIGATMAAIACNTAHVPEIFDRILIELEAAGNGIRLFHMIREAVRFVKTVYPELSQIGVLSTSGSYIFRLYEEELEKQGLKPIRVTKQVQEQLVHPSIYDPTYGVKSTSPAVKDRSRSQLLEAVQYLQDHGAAAVILGCTEIPLVIPEKHLGSTVLIDPNWVLARILIKEFDPTKLKN